MHENLPPHSPRPPAPPEPPDKVTSGLLSGMNCYHQSRNDRQGCYECAHALVTALQQEIATLKAQLADAERANVDWLRDITEEIAAHRNTTAELDTLRADQARLTEALKRYGKHHHGGIECVDDCTCGLADALAVRPSDPSPGSPQDNTKTTS